MALVNKTERAKQYLLGTLSEADKARFEEDYFEDDELFEEIEISEGELVDAFLRNELSEPDRKKFETILIDSPRLAQRVQFARTLKKSISNQALTAEPAVPTEDKQPFWRRILFPKSSSTSLRFAIATYVLFLLLGGGALFLAWMRLRAESIRLAAERAELQQRQQALVLENEKQKSTLATQLAEVQAENARLSQQLESALDADQQVKPRNTTVAFLLTPGGLRSTGRLNIVEISPDTARVQLRLALQSADYSLYSATVKTAEQNTVWSKAQLKPYTRRDGKVVELLLPVSTLPNGTYVVELSGSQDSTISERLSDYSFQVVRKRN